MKNKTVVKAKADVKKGMDEVGKAAANLRDDVMADVKKLKANLEHNDEGEKKADATRITVGDADTVVGPDFVKNINDGEADTEAARDTVESIFGVDAGIVWNALNLNGPMTIENLVKATTLNPEDIYAALGWLGRENKISLETRGAVRFFSLRL
jgi:hypothetical protein